MNTCFQEWNPASWSFLELDSSFLKLEPGSLKLEHWLSKTRAWLPKTRAWLPKTQVQFSSVVQFYNCVNRLGAARIQLQEAPGGQIPLLEAGSHLKPYSSVQFSSVVQFYDCVAFLGSQKSSFL